jgi:hypothetical protein
MSVEEISAAAGVLLSLGFSYVPGLNDRYARLDPTRKRLVMLGLLALVAGAVYGLACLEYPFDRPLAACSVQGAGGLLRMLVIAAVANQSAFALSPRPSVIGVRPACGIGVGP